jgi:nitrate/nitrite transport system permease protein
MKAICRELTRPWVASVALFCLFVLVWQLLTSGGSGPAANVDPEYARLAGQSAGATRPPQFPRPARSPARLELLRNAFDAAIRTISGSPGTCCSRSDACCSASLLAVVVRCRWASRSAVSVGLSGAQSLHSGAAADLAARLDAARALHVSRQQHVRDLHHLHLRAVADADQHRGRRRARSPEWVNVSRVFGVGRFQHVTRIVFPASVPMIMTGMRISIGIAWFVIVAAEMVGAQSGSATFIWNEWNNLQLASMIVAIVLIGVIGLGLDSALAWIGRKLSFRE